MFCVSDFPWHTWCGEEITGESRWSNAVLAQYPVQSWPEEQRRRFGWP